MNATTTTPAATTGKASKANGKAEKVARPKRGVTIGADGVQQLEAYATSLQATLGFRPTAAQVVSLLLTKAKAAE